MGVKELNLLRWKGHKDKWAEGERECTKCKRLLSYDNFHKHKQCLFGVNCVCKDCRKESSKKHYDTTSFEYRLYSAAKGRAKRKNLEFNISIEDIYIQEKCPVLLLPYEKYTDMAPSLDRINNNKGYIKGNVIVMSKRANRLKGDFSINEILLLLKFYEERGMK